MAKVTIYGTEVANPPAHLRWKMAYEITETSATYSVSLVGILQTGSTSGNLYDTTNAYLNATGKSQTSWSENGKKNNLRFPYSADWEDTTIFSSRIISWNKTHSTQSVSISLTAKGVRISNASVSKSFTIQAKPSYAITYNANGGTGAPTGQTKWYGETLTLSSTRPTRTGYTFKGWATTQARANAGTVDYSAGGTYSANSTSNITLWAAWSPNPYAVTYNANGGSGAPASQTKYHGTNLTLQSGVPVKAGWLFRGWATSEANATARKNSGTAEYLPGGTYTGNEPLTLWAIWHAIYTYSLSAKRVGADKSSTEDTNGEWVRIEVSITSAEASGNPITAITFTDEETAQSVSWYATNDGSGSAITFPYQPTADNIKLYAWYQRTTASERAERYNLSAKVDDAIKSGDIKTTTLPPVFRLIDAKPPGKGIAFGKAATEDDLFECELDAMFNNSLKKINADGTEIDYEISDATIALYDALAGGTSWRE